MLHSWWPLRLSQVTERRYGGSTLQVCCFDTSMHIFRRHFQNHFTELYQLVMWHLNLHSEKFSVSMSAHDLHLFTSCRSVISKRVLHLKHVRNGQEEEPWQANRVSCLGVTLLVFQLIIWCFFLLLPKSFYSQLLFFFSFFKHRSCFWPKC